MSSDVHAKCTNSIRLAATRLRAVELVAQEVLDGLDVVIRIGLERLHVLRVVDAELVDDLVQHVLERRVERRELARRSARRRDAAASAPRQRALADQRVFGEVSRERCRFAA